MLYQGGIKVVLGRSYAVTMNALIQALLALLLGQSKRDKQARRASRWVIVYGPDGAEKFREPVISYKGGEA